MSTTLWRLTPMLRLTTTLVSWLPWNQFTPTSLLMQMDKLHRIYTISYKRSTRDLSTWRKPLIWTWTSYFKPASKIYNFNNNTIWFSISPIISLYFKPFIQQINVIFILHLETLPILTPLTLVLVPRLQCALSSTPTKGNQGIMLRWRFLLKPWKL